MLKKVHRLLVVSMCIAACGCHYARVTVSSNVNDFGEHIRTKYRYQVIPQDRNHGLLVLGYQFAHLQPDVFDNADGIPITLTVHDPHRKDVTGGWTAICSVCTFSQFPYFVSKHSHRRIDLAIGLSNAATATVETCSSFCEAVAMNPVPLLFSFSDSRTSCFGGAREFSEEDSSDGGIYATIEMDNRAIAYGIAVKLKELEDAGMIDETLSVRTRVDKTMADSLAYSINATAEASRRFGTDAHEDICGELKILKCESEKERDFAYRFVIVRKDGQAPSFADYNNSRNAFRDALRAQYSYAHPDANPRYLAVDFLEYSLREGRIEGRAVILIISPKCISYDSASRKGTIGVMIGASQFEEVRRWMRKNIEAVATRSNIAIKNGDSLPQGARFYIERESLNEDGVYEIEFKTE